MDEWILQEKLTTRWANEGPTIAPFGLLTLIAWELMFPSWDINHSSTRWNEPSIDFVFLTESGGFVIFELKHKIGNEERLLSAFCQVTDRAIRFAKTYKHERLIAAHARCVAGACGRENIGFGTSPFVDAPRSIRSSAVYRIIGAVEFPTSSTALLHRLNRESLQTLRAEVFDCANRNKTNKRNKEYPRFLQISCSDYEALSASPVLAVPVSVDTAQRSGTCRTVGRRTGNAEAS